MSEAGWYRTEQGRMQYWDGRQWAVPEKKRRAWPWVLGALLAVWLAVAATAVVVVLQDRPWERLPLQSAAGGAALEPTGEFRYSVEYTADSELEEEVLEVVERFLRAYSVADCDAVEAMMFASELYGLDCAELQNGIKELWFGVSLWEMRVIEGWFEGDMTVFTVALEESYRYFGTMDGPYTSTVSFMIEDGRWKFLEFE